MLRSALALEKLVSSPIFRCLPGMEEMLIFHYYQTYMLYKYDNGGEKLKNTNHPSPLSVA